MTNSLHWRIVTHVFKVWFSHFKINYTANVFCRFIFTAPLKCQIPQVILWIWNIFTSWQSRLSRWLYRAQRTWGHSVYPRENVAFWKNLILILALCILTISAACSAEWRKHCDCVDASLTFTEAKASGRYNLFCCKFDILTHRITSPQNT
jgi:hypothetical protein